jgi:hypothetical protein
LCKCQGKAEEAEQQGLDFQVYHMGSNKYQGSFAKGSPGKVDFFGNLGRINQLN